MPLVVQKYGGSSVADTASIKRVAKRIAETRSDGKDVVVVVSAMGNTTDEFMRAAKDISDNPSRRELDMLLSCGERASMALLCMAVQELGYEAISFTGSQCGILTNDRHSGARIVEVRPIRVVDEIARGRVVIVAGFQGVSYKREVTTLGRGGSDITAVALAAALDAEYCEICSDVDGVMTADPRIVDAATLIECIGHDEMTELAAHGARVLHVDSVDYARRAGIALYARNTNGAGSHTRVERVHADATEPTVAIADRRMLHVIEAPTDAGLVELLAAHQVPALAVLSGTESETVIVDREDVPDWDQVAARIASRRAHVVSDELGAVTLVGSAIGRDLSMVAKARAIAREANVRVHAAVSSYLRLMLVVNVQDTAPLSAALHEAFVTHSS